MPKEHAEDVATLVNKAAKLIVANNDNFAGDMVAVAA
jgi:hypothetical protein